MDNKLKNPFNIECIPCNEKALDIQNKKNLKYNKVVHGYGDKGAKIVLVGEGPGKNGAAITGIPFTKDESGKRIQITLINCGFGKGEENEVINNGDFLPNLNNVYLTNLFRFYGYKDLKDENKRIIHNCSSEHLLKEILGLTKLKRIIAVGKIAQNELIKKKESLNFDKEIEYLEHPSPRNHKNREEWIQFAKNILLNKNLN